MNARIRKGVLGVLDRMQRIIEADMLIHGEIITPVLDEERKHELCGGRKTCAIGTLWVAGGVRPEPIGGGRWATLDGTTPGTRRLFLMKRHVLRAAYEILNEVAREEIVRRGGDPDELERKTVEEVGVEGSLETLFESHLAEGEPGDGLVGVVAKARERVEAMA